MHPASPSPKSPDEEPGSLVQQLRTNLEDANAQLPELYEAACASIDKDNPAWIVLGENKKRSVREIRRLLRQILHDFERTAASDGSWPDTQYSVYMEHDPDRLVEVYFSDTKGLMVTLDFSRNQFKLEAKQFSPGTTIPRPNWNAALTESDRAIIQQGRGVDAWQVLEGLTQ